MFFFSIHNVARMELTHITRLNGRRAFRATRFRHCVNYSRTSHMCSSFNGKCVIAHNVLEEMPETSPKQWDVLIRACCVDARYESAVSHFCAMQHAGVKPDQDSVPGLLKCCAALLAEELGKVLHGYVVKQGYMSSTAIAKSLMNMYAKCGSLNDCHKLFYQMSSEDDTVLWNILLSGYAGLHFYEKVFHLLHSMHICPVEPRPMPNEVTFAIVIPICGKLKDLMSGRSVHAFVMKTGINSETVVGNALLSMYAKCGEVCEACSMFHAVLHKDVISWNAMVAGYIDNGLFMEAFQTFCWMLSEDVHPNYATLANVLPILATLDDCYCGKEMHAYIVRRPFLERDVSVCNALMTYYSRIGHMKEAESIFRKMSSKDMVSWNTVIAGFASNGLLPKALELYHELITTEMKLDSVTVVSVLPVCAQLCALREGQQIHEYILRHEGLSCNTEVGNALISFYAKCGRIEDASQTFKMMTKKDLISWNTLLAAYAESGEGKQMLDLLYQMQKDRITPDYITILSILRGSAILGIRGIKETHAYSMRTGILNKVHVGNAIIDVYAKCDDIDKAFKTFKSLIGKNVITGNSMISGCVKKGYPEGAELIFSRMCEKDLTTWNLMIQVYAQTEFTDRSISLFRELQHQGMRPDAVTLMSVLPVCAFLASIYLLRQLHGFATRVCFGDVLVEGALVDVYSKCGNIKDADRLFQMSSRKDLVIFTAMIRGYAMCGMGKEALGIFSQLLESAIQPDHVLMTAVLAACSHAGLAEEGWKHFSSMKETYGIEPTMEHYSCMVDMLARSGSLKDAYNFIMNMRIKPNANVWGTLLGACKIYREMELGRLAADHLFEVEEYNIGNYVVMSNIYAAAGRWDGVEEVRRLMKQKDFKKPAGCSWTEVDGMRHVFAAGDYSHPERISIYSMLNLLDQQSRNMLNGGADKKLSAT